MKNMQEYFDINLPKWSALLVVGDQVSREQAMEILIRTDYLGFACNEQHWESKLIESLYGVKFSGWSLYSSVSAHLNNADFATAQKYIEDVKASVGQLNLCYLENARIASSWIGGTHGWCDWDGTIHASTYNIGKYPTVKEVYLEWCMIAEAFPFLKLRSQLMNCECGYPDVDSRPVIEFTIENGTATMSEPEMMLIDMSDYESNFRNEIGCTIETFNEAVALARNKQINNK